jgi:signal transduction histidine kinase
MMARPKLRSELLISSMLIILGLTGAIVLIVRGTVRSEIDQQVRDGTSASLHAFESVQLQREVQLSRSAAILADLPTLKALMTTEHALTIQDASDSFWKLAGSDLLVLATADGRVLGLHANKRELTESLAQSNLTRSLEQRERATWWYADGQLYQAFIYPILAGAGNDKEQLGVVAVGYQVNRTMAQQLALASGSEVALTVGQNIVASTLAPRQEWELERWIARADFRPESGTRELGLGGSPYEVASAYIYRGPGTPVQCYALMPLGPVNHFIRKLDWKIYILGILAVACAALSLIFFSRTITRPLDNLIAGVRALASGDYTYSVTPRGSSEVAELGEAFSSMRRELLESQKRWADAERVAALGRAASSISHDLRHYLATVVANAEFLYEAEKLNLDRDEVYDEIKSAADQMTELLDSLRELARDGSATSPSCASIAQTVRRAADAALTQPDLRTRTIEIHASGEMEGVFDPKKIERVFLNLLLNACEATSSSGGRIEVDIQSTTKVFEVRVTDNGSGIPESIRSTLFDPFISSGKARGTGLGLAIVSKIVRDHEGAVSVERTSESGTVFLVKLPRALQTQTVTVTPDATLRL